MNGFFVSAKLFFVFILSISLTACSTSMDIPSYEGNKNFSIEQKPVSNQQQLLPPIFTKTYALSNTHTKVDILQLLEEKTFVKLEAYVTADNSVYPLIVYASLPYINRPYAGAGAVLHVNHPWALITDPKNMTTTSNPPDLVNKNLLNSFKFEVTKDGLVSISYIVGNVNNVDIVLTDATVLSGKAILK